MTNQELREFNAKRELVQVCVVTRDLEKTMKAWVDYLKIGPWDILTFTNETLDWLVVGGKKVEEPFEFKIACSTIGNVDIEIIQPVHGPTIYEEFLQRKGEGLHHIKEKISDENWDAEIKKYADMGIGVMQTGKFFEDVHAYMDSEHALDFIYELGNCPKLDMDKCRTGVYPPEE